MSIYIMAKDPEVRARLIREEEEYNESLRKPIDWDDPQVQKNIMEQKARTMKWREDFIAKRGLEAYKRYMNPDIKSPNEDYTSTFEYLESKKAEHGSYHAYIQDVMEDKWGEGKTIEIPEEKEDRPMTRREKFRNRPCLGCPDCRHWDVWKCECTNPKPNPEICDWISERYREKGE